MPLYLSLNFSYSVLKYLQYLLLRLYFIVWNIFLNIYKNLNMQNIGWVFRDCVDKHLVLKNNCHNEDAFALQLASPHESLK